MSFIGHIIHAYLKRRIGKIRKFVDQPLEFQERLWNEFLTAGRETAYGRDHRFDTIHSMADFRQQVPLVTYEQFKPYIQRIIGGEQKVTWPSTIKWMAKSSGTTNDRSKFIPVSTEALDTCHLRGPRDLICMYANDNPNTNLFGGKSLIMGGSHHPFEGNSDLRFGDISAVMSQQQPALASFLRAPSLSISLMDEWEAKIEAIAKETLHENITNIGGVPSWILVLLRRLLEMKGVNDITAVWPNLELYIHGGVNFEPYRSAFRALIPSDTMRYYQAFNASEGFFAYQENNDRDDMLLALNNGVYYEFIAEGHYREDQPPTCGLEDVRVGEQYEMVITTNAGLWRYRLGDTITFTSTFPFRIQVSGRTKHFINAVGEEVIVAHADASLASGCDAANGVVKEYMVAPLFNENGGPVAHQWLIEFEREPEDLSQFMQKLDERLKQLNSDYEAKRYKDLALAPPQLILGRPGLFYDWMASRKKLGGQHKVPRLANDRKLIDDILRFNR